MTKLSRANLTAHAAADPKEIYGRPALAGLHFLADGTYSADGFKLIRVPYPDGGTLEGKPLILPAADVEAFAKATKKPASHADYRFDLNETTADICASSADKEIGRLDVTPISNESPSFATIIPAGEAPARVTLNIRLLLDVAEAFRRVGADALTFDIRGNAKPVVITPHQFEESDKDERAREKAGIKERPDPDWLGAFAVVMPMFTRKDQGSAGIERIRHDLAAAFGRLADVAVGTTKDKELLQAARELADQPKAKVPS